MEDAQKPEGVRKDFGSHFKSLDLTLRAMKGAPSKSFKQESHLSERLKPFFPSRYQDSGSSLWPQTWSPRGFWPAGRRVPMEARTWAPGHGGQGREALSTPLQCWGERGVACSKGRHGTRSQIPVKWKLCLMQVHTQIEGGLHSAFLERHFFQA